LNGVLISDEAHCHTSGFVKKQSMLYWAPLNPIELHEERFSSSKVENGVQCRFVGPFLFENDKGETLTVTAERYIAILQNRYSLLSVT
jgi:CRISPR/Cas system CMR-associated protein Cmr3 (group 5 of RAMP superfamily)